jgi:hypothetical protein
MSGAFMEYSVKARLGGCIEDIDELQSREECESYAYERLWSELQELVLRGGYGEFKATFDIVVLDFEPVETEEEA